MPPRTPEQEDARFDAAMSYVASKVDFGPQHERFHEGSRACQSSGKMKTRIYAGMPLNQWRR